MATQAYLSSSSGASSATSSTASSSGDVLHLIPAGITKQARNKLLEHTAASQGYHSDTWDTCSHEPAQLPPARYKHFADAPKKGSDTAGSTSDASLNDTDPMPAAKGSSSSSASCSSSTSSAAAISGATTLSSTSGHSFSAAVHQSMAKPSGLEPIKDSPQRRPAPIELPIFYQGDKANPPSATVKSPTAGASSDHSNDSYNTDLYA